MRKNEAKSPYYLFDISSISKNISNLNRLSCSSKVKCIYSIKSNSNSFILYFISNELGGFSVSSLFEALLIDSISSDNHSIHFTTPGIRPDEVDELCQLCDCISFNSLSQWDRYKLKAINNTSPGLRINPQLSFVEDERYNPSAKYSKLGVPLEQLVKLLKSEPSKLDGLEGLHFHTNSESNDFSPLLKTIRLLDEAIYPLLNQVKWINLGGGYYFDDDMDVSPFEQAIELLKSKYDLEVIIEPGAALVQEAGSLVSNVVDLFESDGKTIAVLDTTVNHLPEVLEFEYKPDVFDSIEDGNFEYILAGASCLAGDKFGTYRFRAPLQLGSRVIFQNVGAYSLVKSHMFNGINLPSIYMQHADGKIELVKEYYYKDFLDRCGVEVSESIRKRA